MIKIKVDLDGLDHVRNKLGKRAAGDLEDAIELDLRVEVQKMAVQAAKESPVDTGALRASILSSPRRGGKMTFYWGSRLPYALRQEYEHKRKRGWMRRAYRVGQKNIGKTISITIKRKLGG